MSASPVPNPMIPDKAPGSRVLVVDDDEGTREFFSDCLCLAGYRVSTRSTGEEALPFLLSRDYDLILLDLGLPGINGLDLLKEYSAKTAHKPRPAVVVISGEGDLEIGVAAMKLGAVDYLRKPVREKDLLKGVVKALKIRSEREENLLRQEKLEQLVRDQSDKIQNSLLKTIDAFSRSLGVKDMNALRHSRRVVFLSRVLAAGMNLPGPEIENVWMAALLHDIGKIGVREGVLEKELPLEAEEMDHIHQHPLVAENILGPIDDLRGIVALIKHHHERWDGSGYPDGLAGENIPLGARIIAVADAYDAMTSERPYQKPLGHEEAVRRIREEAGKQFDPALAELFARIFPVAPAFPD